MAIKSSQSGRSMVEMLGALVIIGVLSIGAIVGYSYSMNKYRANETTQDINLRMLDLMTQLTRHPDMEPNLSSSWGTKGKFYPMDVVYDPDTFEYALEVENVSQSVCQMVFDNLITSYSIEIGTERYIETTNDAICGETNTMAFYLEKAPDDTVEKCGVYTCNICQICDENTKSCQPLADNTLCTIDDKDGVCLSGECEITCATNNDCPTDYFCQAGSHCDGSDNTCESVYSACSNSVHPFSFEYEGEQFTWYFLFPIKLDTQDSALNACKALGKNLITPADVEPRTKSNAAYVAWEKIGKPLAQSWFNPLPVYGDDGACNQKAVLLWGPSLGGKEMVLEFNGYKLINSFLGECDNGQTSTGGQFIICK